MRSIVRLFVGTLTVGTLGLVSALPSACSSEDGGTSGRRIALEVKIKSDDARQGFTNAYGWRIDLDKVLVATGALYYFDGATIFSRARPPTAPARRPVERLLGIKSAFAHPGHYVPGNARGQLLGASSADLRGESTLGTGDGISGPTRSATFSFQVPSAGPYAAELGAHVAVLEGKATKGAETRLFRAEIDPSDVMNTKNAPAVEGCPFVETDMQADGVVTANVKVSMWLDQAELDLVPPSADGRPVLLGADTGPRKALARGMKAGLAYVFSYAPR